ncbi:uncharacterized protein BJ171DRAFT_525847 [Polychytrium aggregatum]|uniref:uncharacterized protein n=1 Tax=Polychytrium aggregatum TaxID=110093 RepID=UPI0022FEDD93|nr:uncharacterized protein BJ171DRAFT_553776 [Polychytrium aggregatum]XP_052962430.1 uncharacterized protein BJ171DRAFT_525738 [Polychytrium aggregatum]XP_052962434.1 uncharacterized protein BJ171DRAFT_525771 [Polychytrium aggregatum]XP_052962438.1 uncharacterized protein BJ171DRAFT_525802 [Polychytrium aggregatum]XP_052962441.1 uncharacterized protein BJ171DRAFT_525847 [Polychytrium aggregatum]KAI9183768.1 hypothetical protein BJ171DRAFT_553776 [Polychytrium aggregatum]KAI9193492.1 hypotheti
MFDSGSNQVSNQTRNVIGTTMSDSDVKNIVNACSNNMAAYQTNVIDNSQCEYCKTHDCSMANISQTNVNDAVQQCTMTSMVQTLMAQTNSVDSQAVASAIQKAQGLLSGSNSSSNNNCNLVSTNMDTSTYLNLQNSCASQLSAIQKNQFAPCATAIGIIQSNSNKSYQQCMLDNKAITQIAQGNTTKTSSQFSSDQTTSGLDSTAIIALVAACLCCCCCISSIAAIGYYAYQSIDSGSGSSGPGGMPSPASIVSKLKK